MKYDTRNSPGTRVLQIFACIALIGLVMGAASFAKQHFDTELFDTKTGYRLTAYRSAVPSDIAGGKLIGLDALEALIEKEKPLLVDVISVEKGWLHSLSFGLLGKNQDRMNIPGSIWLPRFGVGRIDEPELASFRGLMSKLTEGNPDKPVVFYCLSDCWVSWNAARRAIAMGYRQVYWFKEGTDIWNDAGLPLVPAHIYDARLAALAPQK